MNPREGDTPRGVEGRRTAECDRVREWIDRGMPSEPDAPDAERHAVACAHCARDLALELELQRAFARPAAAPDGFTGAVMRRVAAVEAVRPAWIPEVVAPPLPWWARAAADPAAVVGFVVAGLLLWRRDAVIAWVAAWVARGNQAWSAWRETMAPDAAAAATPTWDALAAALARPEVLAGIAFAVAPALAWLGWSALRWSARRS